MHTEPQRNNPQILIADVLSFVSQYFKIVILIAVLSATLGYLASFLITNKYKAQALLLPEYSMGGNSFFSAINSQAAEGAEKLTPDLYPTVLRSSEFGAYLLKLPVLDQFSKSYGSLKDYLDQNSKPGLLARILPQKSSESDQHKKVILKNSEILTLSKEEEDAIKFTSGILGVNVEKKDGIITLHSEMTDPVIAAQIVEAGKKYLIEYVEDYRTAKTKGQAEFLEVRVKEARRRQQHAEYALQSYRDRNRNTYLNVARIEEQRLQSDYSLAQSLYADLIQRLEQANIKVKQEKPVFKVLEPVRVPNTTSGPRRLVLAAISGISGAILSLFYILIFIKKVHKNFLD